MFRFGVAPPASWMAIEISTLRLATTAQGPELPARRWRRRPKPPKSTDLLFPKPSRANQSQLKQESRGAPSIGG
jgi:hypothetical protein